MVECSRNEDTYLRMTVGQKIDKARKANETRWKAAALGAEEQAAEMVDTEREDGDETGGEENAIRGTRRGRRGTLQQ
jgi:hypothetical protein